MNKTQVYPVKAFQDNYIWTIYNETHAVVVDPGESEPVLDFLRSKNLKLAAILITHHHFDHVSGIEKLVDHSNVPVYGPKNENIPLITHTLVEDDTVDLELLNLKYTILDIPGHTSGHIAYADNQNVFCGDTLFSCGCGRIFEGTPQQMFESIGKLASLPDSTKVYCTHEYTLSNIKFALALEPENPDLLEYEREVKLKVSKGQSSLPSTIGFEKIVNPFLRCDDLAIASAAKKRSQQVFTNEVEVFTAIREWKNTF